MARNIPAIINAIVLIALYFYLAGALSGIIGQEFAPIVVGFLVVGIIAELWFVIKSLS